jgi:hypothetical protein
MRKCYLKKLEIEVVMKKIPNWAINSSLLFASLGLCFIVLEIACRVLPWSEYNEYQINNL